MRRTKRESLNSLIIEEVVFFNYSIAERCRRNTGGWYPIKNFNSIVYLLISAMVSLFIIFLDPISTATKEQLAGTTIYGILIGTFITLVYSALFLFNRIKRDGMSIIAFILTTLNTGIILLVLAFGALFV